MRGQNEIFYWRTRGKAPNGIVVDLGELPPRLLGEWIDPDSPIDQAFVHIPATDDIKRLDLRFSVGLDVYIDGKDDDRVSRAFDAFCRAGAARVLAHTMVQRGEVFNVARIRDSKGKLNWQK